MKQAKQKLGKSGGFTLVEMLIVVAIIAILIAVSIPLISTALEKARHAVDDANERDAIALATVFYLTESGDKTAYKTAAEAKGTYTDGVVTFGYHVTNSQGELGKPGTNSVKGECKNLSDCDTEVNGKKANRTNNKYLVVQIDTVGKVTAKWTASGTWTE